MFFSTDCSNIFSSSALNKKEDWWNLWVLEAWTGGRQLESFLQREVWGRLVRTSRTKGGDHASEKIRAAYRVLSSFKIGSDLICAKTSSKLGLGQIMSISKFQHTILNTHKYNTPPPTNTQTAIPLIVNLYSLFVSLRNWWRLDDLEQRRFMFSNMWWRNPKPCSYMYQSDTKWWWSWLHWKWNRHRNL